MRSLCIMKEIKKYEFAFLRKMNNCKAHITFSDFWSF